MQSGFTLTEIMIAFGVVALIGILLFRFQQTGRDMFSITAWKQDRTQLLQTLLNMLREDLHEAANEIKLPTASGGLVIITENPLKYRKDKNNPKILEFNLKRKKDDGSLDYQILCSLGLNGQTLGYSRTLVAGAPPPWKSTPGNLTVSDVTEFNLNCRPVYIFKKTGFEFIATGAVNPMDVEESGAFISLDINISPPANIRLSKPISETLKTKVNVKAQPF